jgi:hypothetical protein
LPLEEQLRNCVGDHLNKLKSDLLMCRNIIEKESKIKLQLVRKVKEQQKTIAEMMAQ